MQDHLGTYLPKDKQLCLMSYVRAVGGTSPRKVTEAQDLVGT